jgi:hypothetical protein
VSLRSVLAGRRHALIEGWEGAERHAQLVFANVARRRGAQAAERLLSRSTVLKIEDIAVAVQSTIMKTLTSIAGSSERRAIELIAGTLQPADVGSWMPVYRAIESNADGLLAEARRLRAAGGVQGMSTEAFRKTFRPQASQVKGALLEAWVWKSQMWMTHERRLVKDAYRRAASLSPTGREFRPLVLREPLFEARTGNEIYDGAILLTRPTPDPSVYLAHPEVLVQIKAERSVSVVEQLVKDLRRERADPAGLALTTRDHRIKLMLKPAEAADPVRLVIAPQLPRKGRFSELPPGVHPVFDWSLLDAGQLDDAAYLLLGGVLKRAMKANY